MFTHVYVESSRCAEEATMPMAMRLRLGYAYGYAAPCGRPRRGEDDDFVVACTNRAVLDVGLLSLHDLRADSLIRPML